MLEEGQDGQGDGAEELLRRALLDDSAAVAVSLRVSGLPLSEALTVIFHGRRDLGTLQTYVTWGSRAAGASVAASDLLRVPCDLDLADADDREEAERLYVEQATALRDALVGADTVLDVWREPLGELAGSGVAVDHSIRAIGPAAGAAAASDSARRDRVAAGRDPRVRGADARGRPAADGNRMRAAGLDARLPARRRPRALRARTSSSSPPSMRSRSPSASIIRRRPCSGSSRSAATASCYR